MVNKSQTQPSIEIFSADSWKDYELLDSGKGLKLERYGAYTFIRPEHQAVWMPALDKRAWDNAQAYFVATNEESGGHWNFCSTMPESWQMNYHG